MTNSDIEKFISDELLDSWKIHNQVTSDSDIYKKIFEVSEDVVGRYKSSNKVFFVGNGGSAAQAQHLAAEFVGRFYFNRPPLAAVALTTDTSIVTAIGNDYGFEEIFSRQIQALARDGDILFAFSTSGNSKNIIRALDIAKTMGLQTVGFTGSSGSQMDQLCDWCFKVPSLNTARIQEVHAVLGHIICAAVEKSLFGA